MELIMRAYRVEKVVSQGGTVQLEALPFPAGEVVEIIILARERTTNGNHHHSLKGSVIEYKDPTEPVAQDEWDALR
jgi:hypothetical protein